MFRRSTRERRCVNLCSLFSATIWLSVRWYMRAFPMVPNWQAVRRNGKPKRAEALDAQPDELLNGRNEIGVGLAKLRVVPIR